MTDLLSIYTAEFECTSTATLLLPSTRPDNSSPTEQQHKESSSFSVLASYRAGAVDVTPSTTGEITVGVTVGVVVVLVIIVVIFILAFIIGYSIAWKKKLSRKQKDNSYKEVLKNLEISNPNNGNIFGLRM